MGLNSGTPFSSVCILPIHAGRCWNSTGVRRCSKVFGGISRTARDAARPVRPARSVAPSGSPARRAGQGAPCPRLPRRRYTTLFTARERLKRRVRLTRRMGLKRRVRRRARARGAAPARADWIGLARGAASRTPCAPSAARAPTRRAQRAPRARGLEETCLCFSAGGCGSPGRARLSHQSWRPTRSVLPLSFVGAHLLSTRSLLFAASRSE